VNIDLKAAADGAVRDARTACRRGRLSQTGGNESCPLGLAKGNHHPSRRGGRIPGSRRGWQEDCAVFVSPSRLYRVWHSGRRLGAGEKPDMDTLVVHMVDNAIPPPSIVVVVIKEAMDMIPHGVILGRRDNTRLGDSIRRDAAGVTPIGWGVRCRGKASSLANCRVGCGHGLGFLTERHIL